jgi:tRNA nucleotidyltransferase (CCA-adding enzyme)
VLVELRYARRLSDEVAALLREHACLASGRGGALPALPEDVRRWLSRVGPARADAQVSLAVAEAEALPAPRRARAIRAVRDLATAARAALASAPPLSMQDLALDGRAVVALLGGGPGPHVGEALRHLLDRVLADPGANTPEALAADLKRWWAERAARS